MPRRPWSLGVSTCPHGPTTPATYYYDDLGRLAQIPHRSGGVIEARSVVIPGSDVAANAAPKLGWGVGDDIYSLTKAGNTPAWGTVRETVFPA